MSGKLGLYIQVGSDPDIRQKLLVLNPPMVLCHLDGSDLPQWIAANLPDTFVVGRYFWTPEQQESQLYSPGAALAGHVLSQKGAESCDAFMLFNEFLGSPVDNGGLPDFQAKANRLDALQVEYRQILKARGFEAVAWNFAAGNWPTAEHYKEHFPLTLAEYHYLGFHVYGWPKISTSDWRSNFLETLRVCDGFTRYTCLITEMAATRAYANQGPDVGWLSGPDPLTLEAYSADLRTVNDVLCEHPNIKGAALFNAAPDHKWVTFAVPFALADRLSALNCKQPVPEPKPEPPVTKPPVAIALRLPFNGDWPLSQPWGANPQNYARFGLKGHEGTDWALPTGTPVLACADGTVFAIDTVDGDPTADPYGIHVRVQHTGYITVYAHLSKVTVKKGDKVKAGDRLGLSGNSGNSTGPHLHLSLRLEGANRKDGYVGYSDPMPYMTVHKPPDKPPAETAKSLLTQAAALIDRALEQIA